MEARSSSMRYVDTYMIRFAAWLKDDEFGEKEANVLGYEGDRGSLPLRIAAVIRGLRQSVHHC